MEFKIIENMASHYKIKGFWKPLFEPRFDSSFIYINNKNKNLNKKNLINDFFNENDIVIMDNMYPSNFGNKLVQKIIWIKKINPHIDTITSIIEHYYPKKDYIIAINKPNKEKIKNILCYHAILKNPSNNMQ